MLRRLSDHIVYLPPDGRTDRPVLAAILGEESVLMIDAGASPAHNAQFMEGLREVTPRGPNWVIITHWHWDHTFGLASLGVPAIGHANLTQNLARLRDLPWDDAALERRVASGEEAAFCADCIRKEYGKHRDIRVALPTVCFETSLTLHLGDVTCKLHTVPTTHTDDSIVVYVPEDEVLFLGDATGHNLYAPKPYYAADKTLELQTFVRAIPAQWVVESHSDPLSSEAFWAENDILFQVAALIREGYNDADGITTELERRSVALPDDCAEIIEEFLAAPDLRDLR